MTERKRAFELFFQFMAVFFLLEINSIQAIPLIPESEYKDDVLSSIISTSCSNCGPHELLREPEINTVVEVLNSKRVDYSGENFLTEGNVCQRQISSLEDINQKWNEFCENKKEEAEDSKAIKIALEEGMNKLQLYRSMMDTNFQNRPPGEAFRSAALSAGIPYEGEMEFTSKERNWKVGFLINWPLGGGRNKPTIQYFAKYEEPFSETTSAAAEVVATYDLKTKKFSGVEARVEASNSRVYNERKRKALAQIGYGSRGTSFSATISDMEIYEPKIVSTTIDFLDPKGEGGYLGRLTFEYGGEHGSGKARFLTNFESAFPNAVSFSYIDDSRKIFGEEGRAEARIMFTHIPEGGYALDEGTFRWMNLEPELAAGRATVKSIDMGIKRRDLIEDGKLRSDFAVENGEVQVLRGDSVSYSKIQARFGEDGGKVGLKSVRFSLDLRETEQIDKSFAIFRGSFYENPGVKTGVAIRQFNFDIRRETDGKFTESAELVTEIKLREKDFSQQLVMSTEIEETISDIERFGETFKDKVLEGYINKFTQTESEKVYSKYNQVAKMNPDGRLTEEEEKEKDDELEQVYYAASFLNEELGGKINDGIGLILGIKNGGRGNVRYDPDAELMAFIEESVDRMIEEKRVVMQGGRLFCGYGIYEGLMPDDAVILPENLDNEKYRFILDDLSEDSARLLLRGGEENIYFVKEGEETTSDEKYIPAAKLYRTDCSPGSCTAKLAFFDRLPYDICTSILMKTGLEEECGDI